MTCFLLTCFFNDKFCFSRLPSDNQTILWTQICVHLMNLPGHILEWEWLTVNS